MLCLFTKSSKQEPPPFTSSPPPLPSHFRKGIRNSLFVICSSRRRRRHYPTENPARLENSTWKNNPKKDKKVRVEREFANIGVISIWLEDSYCYFCRRMKYRAILLLRDPGWVNFNLLICCLPAQPAKFPSVEAEMGQTTEPLISMSTHPGLREVESPCVPAHMKSVQKVH